MSGWEAILLLAVGMATGVVSGLLGVGGGLLLIPALVLLLGYDQHLAEGTSLLVILPTAAVGAYTHHRNGFVRVRHAIALGLSGIAGAVAGSLIANALEGSTLRTVFVFYLVVTGLWMVFPRRRGRG
jgi:uncharacterized membrane protein YfcA